MRRGLNSVDERLASLVTLEPPKFLSGDDDDFGAAVNGDVLRPFAVDPPHELAETCLGILQQPMAGQ